MAISILDTGTSPSGSEPSAAYWARRAEIAALAAGPGQRPQPIAYLPHEHEVWEAVCEALAGAWDAHAADELLDARATLDLDPSSIPQLTALSDKLRPCSGFRYEAVPGLVDKETFFLGLSERRFLSTQYVRWEGSPLYTPEPDVIHEVIGHAHLLADPRLARLHQLAGSAIARLRSADARQFVADVFWFSGEFGVLRQRGEWKAYGAGLLSSVGELSWFSDHAEVRPLDITEMGTLDYDITHYQPVLFGAESVDHVLDEIGGFFARCSDTSIADLLAST